MRYATSVYGGVAYLASEFNSSATVNVTAFNLETGASIPLTVTTATEIVGTATGGGSSRSTYRWSSSGITTQPTVLTQILVIFTNPTSGAQDKHKIVLGGFPNDISISRYEGRVTVDTVSGTPLTVPGTFEFPIGTPETPVSNITDAITILNFLGLSKVELAGSATLAATMTDTLFTARHADLASLNLGGQNVTGSRFENISLTGNAAGSEVSIDHGRIVNVTNLAGVVREAGAEGTISIAAGKDLILADCYSRHPGETTMVLDLQGGANTTFQLRNYSGGVEILNMSGAGTLGSLDIDPGQARVHSTNTAGTIVVRGNGRVTGTSGGTTLLTEGMMSLGLVSTQVFQDGFVYVDDTSTLTGTAWPNGTIGHPVKTVADGISIANERKLKKLFLRSGIHTIISNISGFVVVGHSANSISLTCNATGGGVFAACTFKNVGISGNLGLTGFGVDLEDCLVNSLTDFGGTALRCGIGTAGISPKRLLFAPTKLVSCYSTATGSNRALVTMPTTGSPGAVLTISGFNGNLHVNGLSNAGDTANIGMSQGDLLLGTGNTAGTIVISGDAKLTNSSAGATVTDNRIDSRQNTDHGSGSWTTATGFATQADILSDATPFAGANIDAAISSRSTVSGILAASLASGDDVNTALSRLDNIDLDVATNIPALISALNDLAIADIQTAMTNQGYTAARSVLLDNLDATISSVNSAIAALNDPDASTIASAVWDLVITGHTSIGTFGQGIFELLNGMISRSQVDITTTPWTETRFVWDSGASNDTVAHETYEWFDQDGVAISGDDTAGNNPLFDNTRIIAERRRV